MKRSVLLFAALANLALFTGTSNAQTYDLSLVPDGVACGGELFGSAGDTIRVGFTASLDASTAGVSGWSLGVQVDGGTPGFDCDDDCAEGVIGKGIFLRFPGLADPAKGNGGQGYLDATVLAIGQNIGGSGASDIFIFYVDVTVPADEAGSEVHVFFNNGLQGAGEVVNNTLTVNNASVAPTTLGECTFTVKPRPAVINLDIVGADGSSDVEISGSPGTKATGSVYVRIDSQIEDPEGVAGWQFSIGNSDEIDITGTEIAGELFDAVPDLGGEVDQDLTSVVDPSTVFSSTGDALCELDDGVAQGKGLVSGVAFAFPPTPGLSEFLPGNTGGPVQVMRIDFEQSVPFASGDDPNQTATLSWKNCLRGLGVPIKTGLTVKGKTIRPAARDGATVTIVPVAKSNFLRGDANDDGTAGDLGDAIFVIEYLFGDLFDNGSDRPTEIPCRDAADSNDDEKINIADPIHMINGMFRGGAHIPPFEACGSDDDSSADSCPPQSVMACQ